MKWLKTIGISALILLTVTACNQNTDQAAQQQELITPVQVEEVTKGTLTVDQTFYGRVSSNQMSSILPTRSGEITDLEVENGDEVEEGDVLGRINPGYISIEAPQDGIVQQLTINEGSLVSTTNPIGAVVSLDPLIIELHATAEQLNLFKVDQTIPVKINDQSIEATVQYIPVTPDDTGLYKIEALFDNPDQDIKPGMIAEATITESKVENKLIVPTEAVIEENENHYIYIIKNGIANKIEVEPLITQTESTAIKGNIQEGDQVVTKGQLTLTDGSKVEVMKEDQK